MHHMMVGMRIGWNGHAHARDGCAIDVDSRWKVQAALKDSELADLPK